MKKETFHFLSCIGAGIVVIIILLSIYGVYLWAQAAVDLSHKALNHIEKHGVKSIVERVWNGTDTIPVDTVKGRK